MSPDELAHLIEDIITNADTKYNASIIRVQDKLYEELLLIIKNLEVDSDGYILQNGANRKILDQAESKVYEVFHGPAYQAIVSRYLAAIPKIDEQSVLYFSSIDNTFRPNRIFLKNLQNNAIAQVERIVLRDGLESQVIQPLTNILHQNIDVGGKYSGFLKQIGDYVAGNSQVEGRALSYSRVYLNNILFQYSRSYQQGITADLGLVWYKYVGGLTDKSREFCIERVDKFWHQSEIERWAALTWKGKDPLTTESSIFILCGGFSCKHELIPVHESIVDIEALERRKPAK